VEAHPAEPGGIRRTGAVLTILALSLGGLAACGGGGGGGTSPGVQATQPGATQPSGGRGGPDPCALLKAEDVAAATGGEVTARESFASGTGEGVRQCNWERSATGSGTPELVVSMFARTRGDLVSGQKAPQTVRQWFDSLRSAPDVTDVPGIGDAAFSRPLGPQSNGVMLFALAGDAAIQLQLGQPFEMVNLPGDPATIARDLAAKAVAALQAQ
jgi:hypothetical protein